MHTPYKNYLPLPSLSLQQFNSHLPRSTHLLPSPHPQLYPTDQSLPNYEVEKAMKGGVLVDDGFRFEKETHLTVRKTSLFFADDGFNVYDSSCELVFRVDSYGPDSRGKDEVVLMDAHGRCLLTVRRKWPSLHQRWEGFKGERLGQKPIFSVRRSSIIGRSGVTVEVLGDPDDSEEREGCFHIEGSFAQRCCTVLDSRREVVAEIRRKVDPTTKVTLGKDVFLLCLSPGFDGAFAMGIVLVLDHITGDDNDDKDDHGGSDGAEVDSSLLKE